MVGAEGEATQMTSTNTGPNPEHVRAEAATPVQQLATAALALASASRDYEAMTPCVDPWSYGAVTLRRAGEMTMRAIGECVAAGLIGDPAQVDARDYGRVVRIARTDLNDDSERTASA